MSKLNDERLQEAKEILERYRDTLLKIHTFDARSLERELRKLWNVGYQELKPLIYAMAQHGRYQEVAAYYMEHSNAPGVVSEFKPHLAALYSMKSYNAADRAEKQKAFWDRVFASEPSS